MTQEEGMFLSQMMHMETLLPRQKVLCEVAENLYGQKYKELVAETQDGVQSRVDECTSRGEELLLAKSITHLTKQMEHYHYSISQLACNMGKLAGEEFKLLYILQL